MNISFIIPNFNGEELLRKNMPHLIGIAEKYHGGKSEIIIADDASKDSSVAYIKECIEANTTKVSMTLLENTSGKNKGFAGNVNKGVKKAVGDIVILLNTDVSPHENFLQPLLKNFTNENIFAVGCMDESIEEGNVVLRGRGNGKWIKGFLMHSLADVNKGKQTLWVSCGSGAFRKSMWETLGGLKELYNPFYWEDIDLSYRAQKAGFGLLFENKSIVTHEHKRGSIQKNYSSFIVKKTSYRNQFFFTWLNATDTMILRDHVFFLPYFLTRAVLSGDMAFLIGFFSALAVLPKVLRERKKIQHMVEKTDKEVIEKLSL